MLVSSNAFLWASLVGQCSVLVNYYICHHCIAGWWVQCSVDGSCSQWEVSSCRVPQWQV